MAKLNFSDWLKSRYKDELTLPREEKETLMKFHGSYLEASEPPPSKDKRGSEIVIGNRVRIEYQITGIGFRLDPETGQCDPNITILSLATIMPDGREVHEKNVGSDQVVKVN